MTIKSESTPRISLDVSIVEMRPIDLAASAELPEDRLQGQERVLSFGIRAARHVGPTVGDRLSEGGRGLRVMQRLILDRLGWSQKRDRDRHLERLLEHTGGHRRVEETQVEHVGIDRVESLSGLGQHLERRAEPVHRAGPSRRLARRGPRSATRGSDCHDPLRPYDPSRRRVPEPTIAPSRVPENHGPSWSSLRSQGFRGHPPLPAGPGSGEPVPSGRPPDSIRVALASSAWVR